MVVNFYLIKSSKSPASIVKSNNHAHFTIRSDTAILLFQSYIFWQLCKSSRYFHQRFDIFSVMSFSPIGFAPFLLFWARSCYGCMIPVSAASCRSLFWIFLPNGNEFRFVSEPLCSYDNSLCDVCQRFCFFCPGGISVPPASIGNLKNCRFFMITTKHLQATFFSQSISAN